MPFQNWNYLMICAVIYTFCVSYLRLYHCIQILMLVRVAYALVNQFHSYCYHFPFTGYWSYNSLCRVAFYSGWIKHRRPTGQVLCYISGSLWVFQESEIWWFLSSFMKLGGVWLVWMKQFLKMAIPLCQLNTIFVYHLFLQTQNTFPSAFRRYY